MNDSDTVKTGRLRKVCSCSKKPQALHIVELHFWAGMKLYKAVFVFYIGSYPLEKITRQAITQQRL